MMGFGETETVLDWGYPGVCDPKVGQVQELYNRPRWLLWADVGVVVGFVVFLEIFKAFLGSILQPASSVVFFFI